MVAHLIAALIDITTCDAAPKFAELAETYPDAVFVKVGLLTLHATR